MWQAVRPGPLLDGLLVLAVLALGVTEVLAGQVHGPLWAALLCVALYGLPLAVRRRWPWIAFAVVYATFGLSILLTVSLFDFLASVLAAVAAVYTVATRVPPRWSVLGLVTGYLVVAGTVLRPDLPDLLWGLLIVSGPWLAGIEIRHRRLLVGRLVELTTELERSREEQAAAAVAAERTSLARDLHDVVAHAVSVIVVQAGAASRVLHRDPAAAAAALGAIEDSGREALADLRRMLAVLHDDGSETDRAPQPGLAEVDGLVERVRRTGLAVECAREGSVVPLPAGLDLAAYRVVQEALTNVIKHADATAAAVTIRYEPTTLEVDVTDDGRGATAAAGGGRGLEGLRARAALYRGDVSAGPLDRGFRVRASFPIGAGR